MPVFLEITIVLLITMVISFVMKYIKQPLVVGYILAGIIVGPAVLDILHSHDTLDLFSKLGITILLFIVGLHLSPRVIKEVGKVSLITGVGQVLVTSVTGFAIALLLGIDKVAAVYVAIALTFSSTIIILKLLSDKGDIHSLYGKIAIGFLLVQDILASIILIAISSFSGPSELTIPMTIGLFLLKGVGVFLGTYVINKWFLPKITAFAATSSELLFIFSLTWGLGFALIFQMMGLSVEIGALIAGICLSTSEYAEEMSSRLRPLRDFFIVLFFVLLGAEMVITLDPAIIIPALVLSLYVLIGNPVIMIIIMNLLGYHRKTGFMAGLTVAQISEFSLILATLGMSVGHISKEILTIITLVGLITISCSSYFIMYSEKMYPYMAKILSLLELKKNTKNSDTKTKAVEVYLFGFNRVGNNLLHFFKNKDYKVGIVDFDPIAKERISHKKTAFFYGDAGNAEFLESLQFDKAKIIISTIPELETNRLLVKYLQIKNSDCLTIVFAQTGRDALLLYEAGATYVVLPHYIGATHITELLDGLGFNEKSLHRRRKKHIVDLTSLA